jgi:hypothetical protein
VSLATVTLADEDIAADAAFLRVQAHRKQFEADWLPLVTNVYRHSIIAWETIGKPVKLDGTPDWGRAKLQDAFRQGIAHRPWCEWLRAHPDTLYFMRRIGAEPDDFLAWYRSQPDELRAQCGHPKTLWQAFARRTKNKEPRKHTKKDDAHDERQEAAARMDALAASNTELQHALDAAQQKEREREQHLNEDDDGPEAVVEYCRLRGKDFCLKVQDGLAQVIEADDYD